MGTSFLPKGLTFFQEVTSGTAPADWVASGTQIRIVDLDVSSIQQSMLADERSRTAVTVGREAPILGIKGSVSFTFAVYLTGAVDTAVTGETLLESPLMTLLEHSMGGLRLAQSQTIANAGTTSPTQLDCVATTGVVVGDWMQCADSNGRMHQRRAQTIAGNVITLHRALPFTPADGSLAVGCATLHNDEDVLEDSQVGPYTFSFLVDMGRRASAARQSIECVGCKVEFTGIELARDAPPKLMFTVHVGSFRTAEDVTPPSFTATPSGAAPVAIGPLTRVFVQDKGTTTNATVQVGSFEVAPGLPVQRIETLTEDTSGLPGTYGYTVGDAPCTVKYNLVPHADDPLTDFNNRAEMHVQYERLAPAGQAWSIYFPRAVYDQTPNPIDVSGMLGQSISLEALHDDDMSTDVSQSRMVLVLG